MGRPITTRYDLLYIEGGSAFDNIFKQMIDCDVGKTTMSDNWVGKAGRRISKTNPALDVGRHVRRWRKWSPLHNV